MQTFKHQNNLIGIFAQHRVAANLLMLMMILAGVFALLKLNTQFFPNFALDMVSVRVVWRGASAEDVERSVTKPIEQALYSLDGIRKMTSTSARGVSSILLEYEEGTEMGTALDQVKEQVALLRNLPKESEKAEVSRIIRYDPIARLLITGPDNPNELRHLVKRLEYELLEKGISKIAITGLPDEEIAIQVPTLKLEELNLTLPQVAQKVSQFSQDIPAGSVGKEDVARQLRSLEQKYNELDFADLPIVANSDGQLIQLKDIAEIERRPREGEITVSYQGKPAVELLLQRAESNDSLEAARIVQTWLEETQQKLPPNIKIHVYDQAWEYIDQRINLLVTNGLQGLILVVAVLFIFLNGRVAFWVAMGIPISILGMLAVLLAVGGSINMISLFGMIMALGVIVDDAIVVGEDAFAHFQQGEKSLLSAEGGAQRMLAPVTAASLTTVSAFLPLMLISGPIGNILFDIPLVMICVLIASLVECFFVLPGHLRHSFLKLHREKNSPFRDKLENGFNRFRDNYFRPVVTAFIEYRWSTVAFMLASLIFAIGLLAGGRISFVFFPTPEASVINANAAFVAGTSQEKIDTFLTHLEETLEETEKSFNADIVKLAVTYHGKSSSASMEGAGGQQGDHFGSMVLELTSPDSRDIRNGTFIQAWEERVQRPPGLETFSIVERRGGPPGRDVEIRLSAENLQTVKKAALELAEKLKTYPGVTGIEDDMPFGQEEWIYRLTPLGTALGLTTESVSQQLRAAFDGHLAQIFQDDADEVEVRVLLPDAERFNLASLENFYLQLPNGERIPFSSAVSVTTQRGFQALRHTRGRLAVTVYADVDKALNNSNDILADLNKTFLPQLERQYGLNYSFEGRAADQKDTMQDMLYGMIFAIAFMYLILAWQFASYGWPLVVMSAIPFGLVGAIMGHWFMGIDLTILSLFGFFGLSGIVVNDSIVLVTFYRQLREAGMKIKEALVEAACQRLRAVLLTSLTTIFGLTPLLFETSLQAQFLIPMATSISFGLMFSTILVLLAIPAFLSIYEYFRMGKSEWEAQNPTRLAIEQSR